MVLTKALFHAGAFITGLHIHGIIFDIMVQTKAPFTLKHMYMYIYIHTLYV